MDIQRGDLFRNLDTDDVYRVAHLLNPENKIVVRRLAHCDFGPACDCTLRVLSLTRLSADFVRVFEVTITKEPPCVPVAVNT